MPRSWFGRRRQGGDRPTLIAGWGAGNSAGWQDRAPARGAGGSVMSGSPHPPGARRWSGGHRRRLAVGRADGLFALGLLVVLVLSALPVREGGLLAAAAGLVGEAAGGGRAGAWWFGTIWSDRADAGGRFGVLAVGVTLGGLAAWPPRRGGLAIGWTVALRLALAAGSTAILLGPVLGHWLTGSPATLALRTDPWSDGPWPDGLAAGGLVATAVVTWRLHGPGVLVPVAATVAVLLLSAAEPAAGRLTAAWISRHGTGVTGGVMALAAGVLLPLLMLGLLLDRLLRPGRSPLWLPALLLVGGFALYRVAPLSGMAVADLVTAFRGPIEALSHWRLPMALLLAATAAALAASGTGRPGWAAGAGTGAAVIAAVGFCPGLAWQAWRRRGAGVAGLSWGQQAMAVGRRLTGWIWPALPVAGGGAAGLGAAVSVAGLVPPAWGPWGQAAAIGGVVLAGWAGRRRLAMACAGLHGLMLIAATGAMAIEAVPATILLLLLGDGLAAAPGTRLRRFAGHGHAAMRPVGMLVSGLACFGLVLGLGL